MPAASSSAPIAIRRARLVGSVERLLCGGCCRCGCASDWRAIERVHSDAFEKCHRPLLGPDATPWFDPGGVCWVADHPEHGVVGFVFLEFEPDADDPTPTNGAPLLDDLFVDPNFQRLGLGRRLIEVAETHARGCGSEQLVLGCLELDLAARAFYVRTGWAADEQTWSAPDGHIYLTFRKPLAGSGTMHASAQP